MKAPWRKPAPRPSSRVLRQIAALKSLKDLPAFLAAAHLALYTTSMLFDFSSGQDYADSSAMIAFADAGGLGLPDRDYYTKTDAHSVEIRQKYIEHVARMLQLLGDSPESARAGAEYGHAHRDGPRQRNTHARRTARSLQTVP